jgi:hypothetical protein
MARPHVEFIQSQALPWQPSPWPHLPGCQTKILSRDPDTGAASAIVRVPPGWSEIREGWLGAGVELFVIEGEIDLNGRQYAQDAYAWLPRGYPFRSMATTTGAVALVFFEAEPTWHAGVRPNAGPDPSDAIEMVDAFRLPWSCEHMDPAYADVGLRWKILRGSPDDAFCTMLVSCPPHVHPPDWAGPQEVHDCIEEMFLLSGDFLGNRGTMTTGAYFWRPPGIAHGPYGTRGGSLALIRTLGAPLVNHWTPHDLKISRAPTYQPVLPDALRGQARQPWRPQSY